MELILRNARLAHGSRGSTDIGIENGKIVALRPGLAGARETVDLDGRLVSAGFVETHIHLDKSGILDRCTSDRGDLEEAIGEVAKAKAAFTPEDVYKRARRTLEKAILQGTTHMRTHLEVDPVIGLRGLKGVLPLVKEYAWAVAGIPQLLEGTGNVRETPPASDGPPKLPVGLRVSAIRHGVTG